MPEEISLDLVKRRFESAKKVATPKFVDFQRWEDWCDSKLPKEFRTAFSGQYADRSALVPSLVRTCRNDLRAKIVNAIFSIQPFFELRSIGIPMELLEKNRKLVMFQYDQEEEKYRSKVAEQVCDWLTYGIGIKRATWVKKWDQITRELIYEGSGWETVDPYKFYPSPYWDSEGNLAYYFILSVVHYQELLEKAEGGTFDLEKVEAIELNQFSSIKSKVEHYALNVDFDSLDLTKEVDKMVCPVLVWTYVDKNERLTITNEKNIIKQVPNHDKSPNLGLSILNLGKKKGEFYGASTISMVEDEFLEKFHIRNQRTDARNVSIQPQFFSDDPKAPPILKSGAGRIHRVSPGMVDNYKPVEFKDSSDKGFIEEQLVTKEIKQSLGLEDIFMGISPQRRETATTNLILQQNAASDLQFIIGQIEDKVICKDIILMLHENTQWFPIDPPRAYAGLDIRKEEIIHLVNVRPLGMTQAVSRPVLASQITGVMEQWSKIPALAEAVEWLELGRRQLQALQFPDPDKILPDSEDKLIPIMKENFLIAQGVEVPVDPKEDHVLHDKVHEAFENSGGLPPENWPLMQMHRREHQMQMEKQMPGSMKGKLITNEQGIAKRLSGEAQPQRGSPREETV